MLDDVKNWLVFEAEPLFLADASPQQVTQQHIDYLDIIAGVSDCVANMALLAIDKILRILCHARLQSTNQGRRNRRQWLATSPLLDDPDITERWRQRAMKAFDFVKGESALAAKPLEFGTRQFQSSSSSCPGDSLPRRDEDVGFGPTGSHRIE